MMVMLIAMMMLMVIFLMMMMMMMIGCQGISNQSKSTVAGYIRVEIRQQTCIHHGAIESNEH